MTGPKDANQGPPTSETQRPLLNSQGQTKTGDSSAKGSAFSFGSKMIKKKEASDATQLAILPDEGDTQEVQETEDLKDSSLKASRELLIPHEPNSYRKEREAEEMNETDVYPIRISLSPKQILRMKIIRIIAFICCFYFIVPFDLYIKDQHLRRIWLYDTDYYFHTVHYPNYNASSNVTNAYNFDLTNCKVYLMQSDNFAPANASVKNTTKEMAFEVEFGFTWGTPFTFNDTHLIIVSSEDQNCIVNVWASPYAVMPKLSFLVSGAQDNLMFQDNTAKGVSLDLSNGLEIQGSKVFVTLSDHRISNLTVILQYGIVGRYLQGLDPFQCPRNISEYHKPCGQHLPCLIVHSSAKQRTL
ncbi:hypothetical protein FGO68_gene3730 [Halteria grandinella]|uniref:Uncharacterized protein n=1 Tax=Halteria grandinella TaxID=5974 RepID=A0A8J8NI07_HALGN|nr:hypothetical protein FGO68_gene3730 [Halteria grandinella]